MRQNEFILKVHILTKKDIDKYYFFELDGFSLLVTAWDIKGQFMLEENVTELYPQLKLLGINEMNKGEMYYKGPMDKEALEIVLHNWGFILVDSEEHHKVVAGLEVECKIKPKHEIIDSQKNYRIEQLELDLNEAVKKEDFESAVIIRDEITKIKNSIDQ